MNQAGKVEELADSLGIDLDLRDEAYIQGTSPGVDQLQQGVPDGVEMQVVETTVVEPFPPDRDTVSDNTYNYLFENGSQFKITVKKRPKCPSCGYVPAEPDIPNRLTGECSQCGTQTCYQCQNRCSGCGTILCNSCTSGHGMSEQTLCIECVGDVEEEVRHSRELDRREKQLQEQRVELEHQRQERKQEWIEEKEDRDLKRREWETVVQVLKQLSDRESRDTKKGGDDHPLYRNMDELYENQDDLYKDW